MLDGHVTANKMISIRTIGTMLIYCVGLATCLAFTAIHGYLDDKAIGATGLNLIGDFVAGIFAPLAFIGLAGAFFLQRTQLNLASNRTR